MYDIVDELLEERPDMPPARIAYGVATAVNTVPIDGSATAVPLPAVRDVLPGQRAAILIQGADKLIIGPSPDPGPVGILLERNTLYSVANGGGGDTIPWSSNETYLRHVPGTFKSGGDDIITIPAGYGGVYHVQFSGEWTANTTGIRQIWVDIGANTTSGDEISVFAKQPGSGTLRDRMNASAMVLLDDGATLTAKAYQNSGASLNITDMRFQAIRIS